MDDAIALTIAEMTFYTPESYSGEIYAAARQYWKDGSRGGFITRMNMTIKFGLSMAFEQGGSVSGVEPDEYEASDTQLRDGIIAEEKSHVRDLLAFLDGLANAPTAKLADADYRLKMWANRYPAVFDQARIHFGGKKRLAWVLGDAEHCETCLKLSRIVAWSQEWEVSGIRPKSQTLACHGYNCQCEMTETTRRRSPKALERIMNAIGGA